MDLVSMMGGAALQEVTAMTGTTGVGHVRYSTTSKSVLENAHPLTIGTSHKFYICHNGTLDRSLLSSYLKANGVSLQPSMTDTELLGWGLHLNLGKGADWVTAFQNLNPHLNGSFSLTILTDDGELIAVRDERGFRPLCLGWHEATSSYLVASESCALASFGAKLIRDVQPGEVLMVDKNGLNAQQFAELERHTHCAFEYTYFAHPSSLIEGVNVYAARKNLGKQLAEKYPLEGDVVIPVPDSARPAALGYSERSGIPFEEGLMKNRYRRKGNYRSFIEPDDREQAVHTITPIRPVVDGKRVILIDDSIVRGTSSEILFREKLKYAKETSFLLTFPPIMFPCYMGIDFPTQDELLVYRVCGVTRNLAQINEKVAKVLQVKALGYNDVEGLSKGIGLPQSQLCLTCTTGDYRCLKQRPTFRTRKELKR
jgi:amidophosphoribosyltransferase